MIERIPQTGSRLQHWRTPRAVILMYHRVAEPAADPWELTVSPQHFADQMAVLHEWGRVLPLQEMVRRLKAGTLPQRAVAVTFDDGYADNLRVAKPLLEKYNVPATFFLATGGLDHRREFWWDELERIFLQSERLPDALGLTISGQRHWWKLGPDAARCTRRARKRRPWRITDPPPTRRHRICRVVWEQLLHRTASEQQAALEQLRAWAGTPAAARSTHRTLTSAEVRQLADSELIEIGAHTVTHPALDTLDAPEQYTEITRSKHRLETLLDRPVVSFSYPYGNYTKATVQILQSVQFERACTTEHTPLRPPLDRFALPRMYVPNVGYKTFLRRLRRVLA